jgi:hypothetical protein
VGVSLLGFLRGGVELHVDVQRADVVAERHEVVARVLLDFCEPGEIRLAPPPARGDRQAAGARRKSAEEEQSGARSAAVAVPIAVPGWADGAALPADPVH